MKIAVINPSKQDYLCETVIEGLKALKIDFYCSDLGNGADRCYSDNELIALNPDLLLVIWGKADATHKQYLVDRFSCPKYYIDGSEWSWTGQREPKQKDWKNPKGDYWFNLDMLKKCDKYFKRECYPEDLKQGVQPLSFGVMNRSIKKQQPKIYDVFCSFGHTLTGRRKELVGACEGVKGKVVIKNNLSEREYLDYVSKSRIVVDAWGGGQMNARMFEVLANKAMLFTQRFNILVSAPLYEHIDYVSFGENIEKDLQYYIDNPITEKIAESGYLRAMEFHRTINRVKEIICTH